MLLLTTRSFVADQTVFVQVYFNEWHILANGFLGGSPFRWYTIINYQKVFKFGHS